MAKLTTYNIAICLVVAIGGFTFGFGSAVFVSSIGQPGFYMYFELDPHSSNTASILGAINGLFYFGAAVGSISQSWLADRLGRVRALASAAVLALVGSALVAGSVAIPMLFVMRILQGCGLGMLLALVPLYLVEVAPPHRRGLLTGLTTLSFGTGYIFCNWISVGSYFATNITLTWRLPLALACVGPLALLTGLLFVPESPRYLVWRDKHEEAWNIIKKLHSDASDEAGARAEFTQIVRQVEADKEENATFYKMFTKPSWRRRSLLVFFLGFGVQCTGIYGITNFLPVIFESLGMTGSIPLILYVIGFTSLAGILLAEALLQWKYLGTDNKPGNAACVLFIFLYIFFFQCVDAPSFIWAAEIFPTNLRAKGISLAVFAVFAGAITLTAPAPLAFRNIGWHMFLIYFVLCVIAAILTYFYIPETKGIPIEEIGALFGDVVVVHLTTDGHGILEDKQVEDDDQKSTVVTVEKV